VALAGYAVIMWQCDLCPGFNFCFEHVALVQVGTTISVPVSALVVGASVAAVSGGKNGVRAV